MTDSDHTPIQNKLEILLAQGEDVIESPAINARLFLGLPDAHPTVFIGTAACSEAESIALSEWAAGDDRIERIPFKGENGLDYLRYQLRGAS